jgi:hypothetical protein
MTAATRQAAADDPVHAALKSAIEVETIGYLWGQPSTFTPYVCSKVFGDGRALLALVPLNTRPAYYVVRIDSAWRLGDEEAPGAPDLWDFIDDIELAVEAEFGDACEADEDAPDEELPRDWPAYNGNSGCSWARMDWPSGIPAELDPHPFARRNVLSDFRIPAPVKP